MTEYKETQAAWARRRCMEQEGRWITKLEHIQCQIEGAIFVKISFDINYEIIELFCRQKL